MPQIVEPIIPAKFDPDKAKYPYFAIPNINGVRFLIINRTAVLETLEPIQNNFIQKNLVDKFPDGTDGKIVCIKDLENTIKYLKDTDSCPDFYCYITDYIDSEKEEIDSYQIRSMQMHVKFFTGFSKSFHEIITPATISNSEYLNQYHQFCIKQGHSGIILRDPKGTYKFGKSTIEDNIMLEF